MASKRRNMFYENKKQETTENEGGGGESERSDWPEPLPTSPQPPAPSPLHTGDSSQLHKPPTAQPVAQPPPLQNCAKMMTMYGGGNVYEAYGSYCTEEAQGYPEQYGSSPRSGPETRNTDTVYYPENYAQEYPDTRQHLQYQQHHEPVGIITSNGLSYTNLDYSGYQKQEDLYDRGGWKQEDSLIQELGAYQEYQTIDYREQIHYQPLKEENIQPQLDTHHHLQHQYEHQHQSMSQHQPHQHHHGHHQITQQHQHQQAPQHHQLQHHPQQHQQQTHGGSLPTYKWMQVKRNVPKPAEEVHLKSFTTKLKTSAYIHDYPVPNGSAVSSFHSDPGVTRPIHPSTKMKHPGD
ncbi:hypothetical protein AAG570_010671 [Ranatra chinensis]|uniref:Uncharacterized protein n=1 Tax=Ranatra chinensis TaxID=642074 RepID=A0ABD0ZBI8_9HEMI